MTQPLALDRILGYIHKYLGSTQRMASHLLVRCPFHGGGFERTPSLAIVPDRGVWYCHGCAKGGSLNSLLRQVSGGIDFKLPTVYVEREKESGLDSGFLDLFDDLPSTELEGFSRQEIARTGVRYDPFRKRVVYPIRDRDWNLVGVIGRLPQKEVDAKNGRVGKYKKYALAEWGLKYVFHKSDHLWPLHLQYRQLLLRNKLIVLVEGFKAALWVRSAGYPAFAVMTAHMSDAQKKLILRIASSVVLWLDWNTAGLGGMLKAAESLYWSMDVNIVAPPDDFDYDKNQGDQPDDFPLTKVPEMIEGSLRYSGGKT